MGMGLFPAERTKKCQAPIKLAQPFPAPELRAEILWTSRFFCLSKRVLVETSFEAAKTRDLKAFQSLENCRDYSTITKARSALSRRL